MKDSTKHIAIFASGTGTNAEAMIRYFNDADRCAKVVLVLSNKADAPVLARARALGVEALYVSRDDFSDRDLMTRLTEDIDAVVLAGFLMMVPEFLVERFEGRMVNIHPSLLPKFGGKGMYGRRVHEAVVASGETETGITVHLVSDECDGGRILFQAKTDVKPSDTPAEIEARVHALEYLHYPPAVEKLLATYMPSA